MANSSGLDVSGWLAGLEKLGGPQRISLARSMAVAGGQVLRDEAKRQAPVDDGTLRDAIYLAFKEGKSNEQQVVYSVTWNAKKAPHGHLLEFGHWQPYVVKKLPNGDWYTMAKGKGGGPNAVLRPGGPLWVSAKPFLRPAFDIAKDRAAQAMLERGRERLQTILSGGDDD